MTMNKAGLDRQDTIDRLDEAICSLMTMRVAIGGTPDDSPVQALDEAIRGDQAYQETKDRAHRAWAPIVEAAGCTRACLDAEAAVNHMAAEACRVGWQLAMVVVAGMLDERGKGPGHTGSSR